MNLKITDRQKTEELRKDITTMLYKLRDRGKIESNELLRLRNLVNFRKWKYVELKEINVQIQKAYKVD